MDRFTAVICCFSLFLLLISNLGVKSQDAFNPDSLKKVLGSGIDEQEKLIALQSLSEGYLRIDADSSLYYSEVLMNIARGSGENKFMIRGYLLRSRAYLAYEMYDTVVVFCDSGIMLAREYGDLTGQAELNIIKSNAIFNSKGPEEGIAVYKESYRLFAEAADSAGLTKALNGIGVMYKKMARYDSAITNYIKMVTIAERIGYESQLGMGYLNLGILYQDLRKYDKAFHYLNLSIPINQKFRPDLVALAKMNVGLIYYDRIEYDSAIVEFRSALKIYFATEGNLKQKADVYNNMGNLYMNSGKFDSAYFYFDNAADLYKSSNNWYTYGQVMNNLGLLQINRGKFNEAIILLDSCLSLAAKTNNREVESIAYRNKYLAYTRLAKYEKALENYLISDSLEDIIYNLDKEKVMADLEMKYQNEKKQAQILEMEKENLEKDLALQIKTRQKNIFLFTGIGIIALMSFAFLYFRQRTVKDRIIAQQHIRQLEEEKKLLAAKSLVEGQEEERKRIATELHDGLGVLLSATKMQFSAIHDQSPDNQALIERASKLLEQASSDVRKISHNMMPGLLTKLGLFEAVADLFEKLDETEGLIINADIPEDSGRMPENKEIMIYRIIQELVNNTLKHAGAKTIAIRMQKLPGHLEINYSDDGKGFIVDERIALQSIGLSSIQSRISFLSGKMELHSEPGKGVLYKFEIPQMSLDEKNR